MSAKDNCKDLSRTVTTSTRPLLSDVSENISFKNSQHSYKDKYDVGSTSTSNLVNSKYYGSDVSKKLTYEILKRYTQIDPLFIFDSNDDINTENICQKPKKTRDGSFFSLHRKKSAGVQYEVASECEVHSYHYSRSNSVCNVEVPRRLTSGKIGHTSFHNMEERKRPEKMIYCYPITSNTYNEEFIFKIAERNRRLQKLVKKMAVAREREKQENAWNNYINELRHKHGYHNSTSKIPVPIVTKENSPPERIEDFYGSTFKCQQSNHCKSILKDFYEPCTSTQTTYYDSLNSEYYESMNRPFIGIPVKTSESYTISPDSPVNLKKDRCNQCEKIYYSHLKAERVNGNTILVDTRYSQSGENSKKTSKSTIVYKRNVPRVLKSSSMQTHLKLLPLKKQESIENVTNIYDKAAENIIKIRNLVDVKKQQRQDSFDSIENKLDMLISSVNTLISEVKTKSVSRNSSLANNNRMTITRSVDAVRICNVENFQVESVDSIPKKTFSYNVPKMLQNSISSKMDNIIVEEMNKSDEAKRDIENILNGDVKESRAVQFMDDDIPTRDRSTEVTLSLSKTKVTSAEEVLGNFSDHRMTIAVNTDPLGLHALLRISKETVKNILSFMQNFSYQNLLQLPMHRENYTRPFVCSVCGAVFMSPTQLAEHIHSHVTNRYCCICRHLTSVKIENPRRIFFCEYCGKPFSRAYCCELHQQTCAKRLGRLRDVTSSLVLLR